MADQKISQLNSLTKSTVATSDVLPIVDTSATETKKITYQELIQPQDDQFAICDNADNTKKIAFQASGITTGTTRTMTVPDANTTLVGTDTTQTLTNKTLTAPQINMGSDSTGDMYYRTAGGAFARLPIGTASQTIQVSSGGIPEWIANPAASDASTTVKGVVEEATQAEVLARTTAGGTSARLFVNPSTLTTVQTYDYAVDSVGTDSYAITVTPAPTAYVAGQVFRFKAGTSNTGTATLNVNSLGAKTIKKNGSTTLENNDILANQIIEVMYDGTDMQLQTPTATTSTVVSTSGTGAPTSTSTTQTVTHNLGRTPQTIDIVGYGQGNGATNNISVSSGTYNASGNTCIYNRLSNPTNTSSSYAVFLEAITGTSGTATGVIQNLTSTTFDIVWTVSADISGEVKYMWKCS